MVVLIIFLHSYKTFCQHHIFVKHIYTHFVDACNAAYDQRKQFFPNFRAQSSHFIHEQTFQSLPSNDISINFIRYLGLIIFFQHQSQWMQSNSGNHHFVLNETQGTELLECLYRLTNCIMIFGYTGEKERRNKAKHGM